jgi:hypothetical protein
MKGALMNAKLIKMLAKGALYIGSALLVTNTLKLEGRMAQNIDAHFADKN